MFRPIEFAYRKHWLVLGIAATLTLLSLLALPHLRVDLSSQTLYSPNDEAAQEYQSVLEEFGSDQVALVIVKDQALFSPGKLRALEDLHSKLESIPYVQKVDSLFTLPDIRDQNGFLEFSPLLKRLPKAQAGADRVKAQAVENPLLLRNVISAEGTLTSFTVYLDPSKNRAAGSKEVYGDLDSIIGQSASQFDSVYQLGKPATHHWLLRSLAFDQQVTLPAAVLILMLLLVWSLRSITFGLIPIFNALIATAWTTAIAVLLGIPLNLLNYIVPLMILVVGATEDVHIIHQFRKGLKANREGSPAIFEVNQKKTLALLLTAGTTMLGFAATGASDLPILQQFGITAFAGIAFRFAISMFVLPATLRLFEHKASALADGTLVTENSANRASQTIIKRGAPHVRSIVASLVAVTAIALYFSTNIESTNDQSSFLDEDSEIMELGDSTAAALSGSTLMYIRIEGNPGEFLYPSRLKQLLAITEHLGEMSGIDTARSFADSIRRINHQLNEGDEAKNVIPESMKAVKQMLLFTRPGTFDAYVNSDYSNANIIVRSSLEDSDSINQLVSEIDEDLMSGEFGVLNYSITGDAVLVAGAVSSIIRAQVFSLGGMALIVFCIISALFLSIRCGLISVATNLFSVALVFGIMGLFNIPLNVGTCMVAAITLGIAIDDTIHLLIQFNRDLRNCNEEKTAIIQALSQEINPIVCTSLALAGGFAILGFSSFEPVRQFGLLSSCVILLALISDLILIPIFFSKTRLITLWDILGMSLRRSLLEKSPFFNGLTAWQAKKLILASSIEVYPPNQSIIREGTTGSTMYVVIEGELEASLERDGETIHLADFTFGDAFGEVGIVGNTKRSADVKTKSITKILSLNGESLEKLKRFSPYLASQVFLNISKILAERLASGNKNTTRSPFSK